MASELLYPTLATACCIAMAGVFGLLELVVDQLQSQADERRAYRLAAELLEAAP